MSAKDDVLDMIEKRMKDNKKIKDDLNEDKDYRRVALDFISDIEEARTTNNNIVNFMSDFNKAVNVMSRRIKNIDNGATVDIHWAVDENKALIVKDAKVDRIVINWSKKYIESHPETSENETIDIMDLLFQ